MLGISGLKFIFISHQKFIVYGQKKHLKRIGCNENAYAAAIDEVVSPNGFCLFFALLSFIEAFWFCYMPIRQ